MDPCRMPLWASRAALDPVVWLAPGCGFNDQVDEWMKGHHLFGSRLLIRCIHLSHISLKVLKHLHLGFVKISGRSPQIVNAHRCLALQSECIPRRGRQDRSCQLGRVVKARNLQHGPPMHMSHTWAPPHKNHPAARPQRETARALAARAWGSGLGLGGRKVPPKTGCARGIDLGPRLHDKYTSWLAASNNP